MKRPNQPYPNVLWLVSDHQLYANRGQAACQLPLQARLAALGTRFERAYTVLPICTPSRASMLTGLYPHNHGLTENDGRFGGRAEINGSDRLISEAFQKADYRCAWFGKWHLSQQQTAQDFGFEGWSLPGYGYPYASADYARYLSQANLSDPEVTIELSGESGTPAGTRLNLREQKDWFDFEAGTALLHAAPETHEAHFLASMATDWINDLSSGERFFMRVDPWGPHPPYIVPQSLCELFADQPAPTSPNLDFDLVERPQHHAEYRDTWVEALPPAARDHALLARRALQQSFVVETALTKLIDRLEALDLLKDTIVIFTADHGDAVASNGGVLNKGGLMVEETMRVPLVMAGPGIPLGESVNFPVANIDLGPTLASMCQLDWDQGDGENLADCWLNGETQRGGVMAQHYGLHVPLAQRAWYAGDWKLVIQKDGFTELYDLQNDPCEMNNLAQDLAQKERLAKLLGQLAAEMTRVGDKAENFTGLFC